MMRIESDGDGKSPQGTNLNVTAEKALINEVARKRSEPDFHDRARRIIEKDQELLERLGG